MHFDTGLFGDIIIILAVAFAGGLTARLLRLPVLLGYLFAGMTIGPHGLGIISNLEDVQTLAEFGVILLLFSVGIEVSFHELRRLGKSAILIGVGQILITVGVGFALGVTLDWLPTQAIVFGLVISLSSTMVVLKTLSDRGELGRLHGRLLTGIMLIQDLAFIPMMAVLPALGGETGSFFKDLGIGLGKATGVLVVMALLAGKVIPWLLRYVAHLGSREVFILCLVSITFISAAATHVAGLSAALGAFVAGVLLSESDFGHRALSEIAPLRDTFSSLFFVALGMLTDPMFLAANIEIVLMVAALVMVVNFTTTAGLARGIGYLPQTALLTGVGMVQIGEFSFILADVATEIGVVAQEFLPLVVVSAVLTMALTPAIIAVGHNAISSLSQRYTAFQAHCPGEQDFEERLDLYDGHAIICGMGRVGSLVAHAMHEHGLSFIGIELDPRVVAQARSQGYHIIHGSSSNETILEAAHVNAARLMVIANGDPVATWVTAQQALRINPELDIVARVYWRDEGERLLELGVREVVWAEMEAGLEIMRHCLIRYHTDPVEVDLLVSLLRRRLSFGQESEIEEVSPEVDGAMGTTRDRYSSEES